MPKVYDWEVVTTSAEQTLELGRKIGELLSGGSLLLLMGDLGAGKTALTHGIARGLGVDPAVPITSPTYTLMNSYSSRVPLYHFDLYRLGSADELLDLGFDEYFYGSGVAVVEWAERCPELARDALSIYIDYVDEVSRSIKIEFSGNKHLYAKILSALNSGSILSF